ncbi:hypothetical protein, partial [Peribacillus butanolivorans]|uniref:hypothetical protein n=1 Tax=Peribacillus butanolivorans TaxID=421767 RepID=UPI00368A8A44
MKRRGNNGQIPSETARFAMAMLSITCFAPSSKSQNMRVNIDQPLNLFSFSKSIILFIYINIT